MQKLRFVDAFSGIGGFHLGIIQACEKLDIECECVYHIEKNKPCNDVYKQYFGDIPPYNDRTDIVKLTQPENIHQIPEHDLLCGGFPCQPFSSSGLAHIRNNSTVVTDDQRSNLYECLLKIIDYRKPTYLLFENVKGLLTIQNEDKTLLIDTIIQELKNRKYKIDYQTISPHQLGIPQKRERVLILGSLIHTPEINIPEIIPISTIQDILEPDTQIDEKYYLEYDKHWKDATLQNKSTLKLTELYNSLQQRQQKRNNKSNTTHLAAEVANDTPSGRSRQHDRAYHITGLSPTLTTVDTQIIYNPKLNRFRKLIPLEYSRLQGFPSDFIARTSHNITDHNRYHQFGNAVCVKVVQHIITQLLTKEQSLTMSDNDKVRNWCSSGNLKTWYQELVLSTLYIKPDGQADNIGESNKFHYIGEIASPDLTVNPPKNEMSSNRKKVIKHDHVLTIDSKNFPIEFKSLSSGSFRKKTNEYVPVWDKKRGPNNTRSINPQYIILFCKPSIENNDPGALIMWSVEDCTIVNADNTKNVIHLPLDKALYTHKPNQVLYPQVDMNKIGNIPMNLTFAEDKLLTVKIPRIHSVYKANVNDHILIQRQNHINRTQKYQPNPESDQNIIQDINEMYKNDPLTQTNYKKKYSPELAKKYNCTKLHIDKLIKDNIPKGKRGKNANQSTKTQLKSNRPQCCECGSLGIKQNPVRLRGSDKYRCEQCYIEDLNSFCNNIKI